MNSIALIGLSLTAVVFLSLVHVLADILRWKNQLPQKYWLSFADGISISYVYSGGSFGLYGFPSIDVGPSKASTRNG